MTAANVVSYSAQVAAIVLVCAALPRILAVRSPRLQYVFWRVLLAVCLLLPIVEPRRTTVMGYVAAPATITSAAPSAAAAPPARVGVSIASAIAAAEFLILLGIAARLAWLSLGVFRLQRLRARGTRATDAFADLQRTIGAEATILWSDAVRQPVTYGLRRPVVLLPVALSSAEPAAQRAVVAHELHHVKRRDWAWIVAEEIVRSVFWFHPALWWLVSRVQLARETVVDELSILTTNARRAYLDALLAFADDTGLASTPAFSARHHLFQRVMLLSKEGNMSSSKIVLASCVLVGALGAGSWAVVRAFPLEAVTVVPEVAPQPAVARDAAIQEAFSLWQKAKGPSLPNDERLVLLRKGIEETDRALSIDPDSRDAMVWKNVMLRLSATLTDHDEARASMLRQADELRDKTIALMKQPSSRPAARTTPGQLPPPPPPPDRAQRAMPSPPPPPPPAADMPESFKRTLARLHAVHIGEGVTAPVLVHDVKPVYPEDLKAAKIQGEVQMEAIVDSSGRVADVRVISGVPDLEDAALDAVRQWEFKPGEVNHEPVAVVVQCQMTFTIR